MNSFSKRRTLLSMAETISFSWLLRITQTPWVYLKPFRICSPPRSFTEFSHHFSTGSTTAVNFIYQRHCLSGSGTWVRDWNNLENTTILMIVISFSVLIPVSSSCWLAWDLQERLKALLNQPGQDVIFERPNKIGCDRKNSMRLSPAVTPGSVSPG